MAKRGRPSSASVAVASVGPVETVARPDPPDEYGLTDEQILEWWAVVEHKPADWFSRETHALLAQHCKHTVSARKVGQLIAQAESGSELDINEYDKLLKMQERESRILSALGEKLCLPPSATRNHRGNKKPGQTTKKPWES
jgi:hypothetical protein